MVFGFGKPKVQLTVIDADDGTVIVKAAQRPEDIPERFDEATTIHLGEQEFAVVEANPIDRASYTKSGKLTLKVRKIELMDASNILFSLPTLCNYIGLTIPADKKGKRILEMHEDDWRQVELISKSLSSEIDAELSSVEAIYRDKRHPSGAFQELHVRSIIRDPLVDSRNLPLHRLKSQLECSTTFDGIGFYTFGNPIGSGIVENGFAFEGPSGLLVYGLVQGDVCTTIGITGSNVENPGRAAEALASLLREFDLILVDWCRSSTIDTQAQIQRYFETFMGGPSTPTESSHD